MKGFVYDGKDGNLIGELEGGPSAHTAGIYGVAWSPDSKQIFTASADKTCKLWDAESRKLLKTFKVNDHPQIEDQQLGCIWQGTEIISIALSGYLNFWDPNQDKPKRTVHGHNKVVTAVCYDPQGKKFYSGSFDALVLQWDPSTGENKPVPGKRHSNQVNKLIVHGGNLVSAAKDDTVRITPLSNLDYSASTSVAVEADAIDVVGSPKSGNLLIAVTLKGAFVIRDGKIAFKLATSYEATCVAISTDETTVLIGGKDKNIHVHSLSGDKLTETGAPLSGDHRGDLTSIQFSPDGKFVASSDANRDIFVWDWASKKIVCKGWQYHTSRVNSVAWSSDNDHIATGSVDGQVIVWSRLDQSKRVIVRDAHRSGVSNVVWVDQNTVLSGGSDSTLKTFDIKF